MSLPVTVVALVVVAVPSIGVEVVTSPDRSPHTRATVPPDASTALRTEAANTSPSLDPRRRTAGCAGHSDPGQSDPGPDGGVGAPGAMSGPRNEMGAGSGSTGTNGRVTGGLPG